MGAGYIFSGISKGIQYGLQNKMSQMSMSLMQRQQKFAEDQLNDPLAQKKRQLEVEKLQLGVDATKAVNAKVAGQTPGITSQIIMSQYDQAKGNVSMLLHGGEDAKSWLADVKSLKQDATAIGADGKSLLSSAELSKVNDLLNNSASMAHVQLANKLKGDENVAGLKQMHDYLLTPEGKEAFIKKTGVTIDQMNKITTAYDPNGIYTEAMEDNSIDIAGRVATWDTKDYKNINLSDVYSEVSNIESKYQNGELSRTDYMTFSKKLKPMAIKMDMAKQGVKRGVDRFWGKDYKSTAQAVLTYVDKAIPKGDNSNSGYETRYNLQTEINGYLEAEGVTPGSVKDADVKLAKSIANQVVAKHFIETYPTLSEGRNVLNPEVRELILAEANKKVAKAKTENILAIKNQDYGSAGIEGSF